MSKFCFTKLGLLFFIIGMIMVLLTILPLLAFIQDISIGQNLPILIGLAIIGFIGLIFYLVAYILMCIGGIVLREFGDKHRKFLLISLIILIIMIVVSVIQSAYQYMTISSIANEAISAGNFDYSPIKNVMYFSIVTSIISGLFYVFILHELENKIGKIILYVAYISSIVISIVITYLFISVFDSWSAQISDLIANSGSSGSIFDQSIGNWNALNKISQGLSNEITKYSIYSIIPSILWLIAMIIPFYRIHSGELQKVQRSSFKCSNCGWDVPTSTQTCPKCGKFFGSTSIVNPTDVTCPKCGTNNVHGATFCQECGHKFM